MTKDFTEDLPSLFIQVTQDILFLVSTSVLQEH